MVSGSPRRIDFMVRHRISGAISPTSGPHLDRWIHSLLQEVEGRYPGLKHVIMCFAMGTPKAVYME
jgi:hypothetical protein